MLRKIKQILPNINKKTISDIGLKHYNKKKTKGISEKTIRKLIKLYRLT